jgi:hypothetical protein
VKILLNNMHDDVMTTTLEREPNEELLAYTVDDFYRINGKIFTGHELGTIECVFWDSAAQEWKAVR